MYIPPPCVYFFVYISPSYSYLFCVCVSPCLCYSLYVLVPPSICLVVCISPPSTYFFYIYVSCVYSFHVFVCFFRGYISTFLQFVMQKISKSYPNIAILSLIIPPSRPPIHLLVFCQGGGVFFFSKFNVYLQPSGL